MKSKAQSNYLHKMSSLPNLESLNDLSYHLKLPKEIISKYSYENKRYYHQIEMKKKTGGIRIIESPVVELKAIQRWVLRFILDKLSVSHFANGFIKNKSILSNAIPHEGNQYILNIDLKDFFTSIPASHVFTIFKKIGYNDYISFILTSFCTKSGYLPQGAPSSPSLSNLVCSRLDHRISSYAAKYALTYTRYADDISISGNKIKNVQKCSYLIKKIIHSEGFTLNNKKIKFLGPRLRREITGLTVTPKITIGKKKFSLYRKRIYDLVRNDNIEINGEQIIQGILSFVASVDKHKEEKLRSFYEAQKKLIKT